MEKSYQPDAIEGRWYKEWEEKGYFSPNQDTQALLHHAAAAQCDRQPAYGPRLSGHHHGCPVTFSSHAGRFALWQPGMDHAGIATQMVVERQLANDGVSRHDIGREKFVEAVWDWKKESGGQIEKQMRRLGASVDWEHDRFTMDEDLSRAVTRFLLSFTTKT